MAITLQNTGEALDQQVDANVDPNTGAPVTGTPTNGDGAGSPADPNDVGDATDNSTNSGGNDPALAGANEPDAKELKKKLDKLLREVTTLGEDYGKGQKSTVDLAVKAVDGAQNNGVKAKDAVKIYRAFKKGSLSGGKLADGNQVVVEGEVDGKVKSEDQQVSKLRKFIEFGSQFQEEGAEATELMSRAIARHLALRNGDLKDQLKYSSTYAALHHVVTVHLNSEGDWPKGWKGKGGNVRTMTDEEIDEVMLSGPGKVKEGADFIKAAYDNAVKARDGKEASDKVAGREGIDNDDLNAAIDALRKAWGAIDPDGLEAYDKKQSDKAADEAVAAFKAALKIGKGAAFALIKGEHNA